MNIVVFSLATPWPSNIYSFTSWLEGSTDVSSIFLHVVAVLMGSTFYINTCYTSIFL